MADINSVINSYASTIMADALMAKRLGSLSDLMIDGGPLDVVITQLVVFVTKGLENLSDDPGLKDLVSLGIQQEVAQGLVRYFFTLLLMK